MRRLTSYILIYKREDKRILLSGYLYSGQWTQKETHSYHFSSWRLIVAILVVCSRQFESAPTRRLIVAVLVVCSRQFESAPTRRVGSSMQRSFHPGQSYCINMLHSFLKLALRPPEKLERFKAWSRRKLTNMATLFLYNVG